METCTVESYNDLYPVISRKRNQNKIVIGIGETAVSNDTNAVIKTMSLGSCVCLTAYSPLYNIAGMVHIALPDSIIDNKKAIELPGYFADTGIKQIMKLFGEYGIVNFSGLIFKLAGGATILDPNKRFNIGERNAYSVKRILWRENIDIVSEDTGGLFNRLVSIAVKNGKVNVSYPGLGQWEI